MKTKILILTAVLGLVTLGGVAYAKNTSENENRGNQTPRPETVKRFANDEIIKQLDTQIKALQEQRRARIQLLMGSSSVATTTASSTRDRRNIKKPENRPKCAPGQMIAKGWIKKNGKQVRSGVCKPLPRGIGKKLPWQNSTSTASTTASST